MKPASIRNNFKEKAKNLNERMDNMETAINALHEAVGKMAEGINRSLGSVPGRLSSVEETQLAVVDLVGLSKDSLEVKIKETRQLIAKDGYDKVQSAISTALEKGDMLKNETVEPDTILFVLEKDKNGNKIDRDSMNNLVFDGHVEVEYNSLTEDLKTLLLGKKVGEVVNLENGATLEIESVYKVNPERIQQTMDQAISDTQTAESEAQ